MSNVYPLTGPGRQMIPDEENEQPVYHLRGHVFKTPIRHCRPRHLWPRDWQKFTVDEVKAASIYLANFAEPVRTIADEIKCPSCDNQVTGHHAILTDWRHKNKITWDPQTFEGRCLGCGYPLRMRHMVKLGTMDEAKMVFFLDQFPLFYHPSATERGGAG